MRILLSALMSLFLAVSASAQSPYLVTPGDVLSIEVLEDPALNREVLVLPDGRFSFPFAGNVLAGGRTLTAVENAITDAIAQNFAARPNVFVSIRRLRDEDELLDEDVETIDMFFLGEVNTPGQRQVEEGTTILQALSQSGGFTRFAAIKRIQLRRTDPHTGNQSVYVINYKALQNGAELVNDFELQEGDVILVPERRLFE